MKIRDLTLQEMASGLHEGQITLLDDFDLPLIERASQRMLENMHTQLAYQAALDSSLWPAVLQSLQEEAPHLAAVEEADRAARALAQAGLSREQLDSYERNGFLTIPSLFPPEEIARLDGELLGWAGSPDVRSMPETIVEPGSGAGGLESVLPLPALVDVDLTPEGRARLDDLRRLVADAAPAARVDDNAQWLAPLASLIGALKWLAAGLVLLMVGATAATVVLAARAALDTHRNTIEILHLMGATDVQVARLFQRRIALDALFGGLVGFIVGGGVLIALGERVSALGSELLGSATIPPQGWALLLALPAFGVVLAMLVARLTILRALGRML